MDGNLVIDSRRSIFLVNPSLTEKQEVVLTETDNWNLTAKVDSTTAKVSTSISPYGVNAIMVSTSSRTETGWPLYAHLGYDPNKGMLVYSGSCLSDVLLKELGIELLVGGPLRLVSYSENLNLEVDNIPPLQFFTFGVILYLVAVSSFVILPIIAVVCVILKKRKRRQGAALNIMESPDNTAQNCDEVGD